MKKKFLALLALLIIPFTFAFTACGKSKPNNNQTGNEIESSQEETGTGNQESGSQTGNPQEGEEVQTPQEEVDPNAIVYYNFSQASHQFAFCPETDSGECTGTTAGHNNFIETFKVEDGVAKIYGSGAWFSYKQCDFATKTYKIFYDVVVNKNGLPDVTAGRLTFGAGESVSWTHDAYISIYKEDDKLYISKGLSGKVDALELTTNVLSFETEFKVVDNEFSCTTKVTFNGQEYVCQSAIGVVENATIYWDIYYPATKSTDELYATMDNFKFCAYDIAQ